MKGRQDINALVEDISINGRFSEKEEKDGSISGTIDKQEIINYLISLKEVIEAEIANNID